MALSINLPQPDDKESWQDYAKVLNQALAVVLSQIPDPSVGVVVIYKGALPTGVLPCDGSGFTQSNYPALYQRLQGGTLPNIPSSGGFNYGIIAQ